MKPECSLNWHQVCLALGVHFTTELNLVAVYKSPTNRLTSAHTYPHKKKGLLLT